MHAARVAAIDARMEVQDRHALLERWTEMVDIAVADRLGSILVVCGEAGIGKTTMVNALVRRLLPPARAWCGYCEDLLSPRPLGPLHDMAHAAGAVLQPLLDGQRSGSELFAGIVAVLERGATPLLVFEDVHWADEATLDLIQHLGRRIDRLSLMLVLTHRTEELGPHHPLQAVLGLLPAQRLVHAQLQPLTETEVISLAREHGHPPEGLYRATGGNPFFVTELLACGRDTAGTALPSTVRAAVLSRLARLPAAEREALETLCVEPGRIELPLAQRLLGADWAQRLDHCVARGLLAVQDQALQFRHELARRATLDALPPLTRRMLHARWLAAASDAAPRAGATLSRLAHHAAEAGDAARVLEWAPAAAAEAAALGAHREAARLYATALHFAESAEPALCAQLHESWSYEAGLAQSIDDATIEARHRAIALWRSLGRADKVGLNLRWLSRLHWYRGDKAEADRYAEEAVDVLGALPESAELAMACSVRSQLFMLADRTDSAIDWGRRAIELAERVGATEVLVHALNNVGTAALFGGRPGGLAQLERSLALALEHGWHEHAARVYTNVSEYGVVCRDYALAERFLSEGLAFDTRHDLDAWTHYLEGWLAQLRLEQGRHAEAEAIVRRVLALPHLTLVMRLPALTVLGWLQARTGAAQADATLEQALAQALRTGEPQRVIPLVLAQAETAWLREDRSGSLQALRRLDELDLGQVNAWDRGAIATWRRRAGTRAADREDIAPPYRLELAGDAIAAARAWMRIGAPFDAGLAYLQADGDLRASAWSEALRLFDAIGAVPAAQMTRRLARRHGMAARLPRQSRGPYRVRREHPLGLTAREQQVLQLLVEGFSNAQIAGRLTLAERTVEHHVSAVLSKLQVADRHAAVREARARHLLDPATAD